MGKIKKITKIGYIYIYIYIYKSNYDNMKKNLLFKSKKILFYFYSIKHRRSKYGKKMIKNWCELA